MLQEKQLCFVIQGNYGYGWEDLSTYPCGERQKDYKQAKEDCMKDLREYNISEGYHHRVIKRYEKM